MDFKRALPSDDVEPQAHIWRGLTFFTATVLVLLTLRWHVLDQAPTGWDDSAYLLQAVHLYQSGATGGWSAFWHDYFFFDRGRVGLITVMAQPFFVLFGPILDAAMVPYALAWFAVSWAVSGIARHAGVMYFGLGPARAAAGGFFALLLFAAFPMTGYLTQIFLVDFFLAVFALLTLNAALEYRRAPRRRWLVALGLFAAGGLMTKVTFPVFALPALIVHLRTLVDMNKLAARKDVARAFIIPLAIVAVICGPYYAINIVGIVRTTGLLSSAALAQTFGFADALDVGGIASFMYGFFVQYTYGLCLIGAIIFAVLLRRHTQPAQLGWGLAIFAVWFLVPVAFVTLSPFKQDRYFYAAMPALAIMGGLALTMLTQVRVGGIFLAALLLVPIAELAVTHGAPLPQTMASHFKTIARAPDPSGHGVKDMVAHIARALDAQPDAPKSVTFLSGTAHFCNAALFSVTAMQNRIALTFKYLPAFENPGMTPDQAMTFLQSHPHDGILYKTGVSFPESFAALDKAIVPLLEATQAYARQEMPFAEPDSCSLTLFARKTSSLD